VLMSELTEIFSHIQTQLTQYVKCFFA